MILAGDMDTPPLSLLLVEDTPAFAFAEQEALDSEGAFVVARVERLEEGLRRLEQPGIDVVLLDLSLPDAQGFETLRRTLNTAPDVPVVVLTGNDDEALAVSAVRAGAQDYLIKGRVDGRMLVQAIRYAVERKRLEVELRAAKEAAEAASRAKSEFLAMMSHEIRTPVNGVIGPLQLLARSGLTPKQQELTRIARTSAEALLGIINDILDFSKIEAGKLLIQEGPFDLLTTLSDVADMLAVRVAEKRIALTVDCQLGCPLRFVADAARVRQVLVNLVGNAVKFTERGSVTVRVKCEAEAEARARLRIEVVTPGSAFQQIRSITSLTPFRRPTPPLRGGLGGRGWAWP